MFLDQLTQSCPFDLPGLQWCEGRFCVADVQRLVLREPAMTIQLPAELHNAVPKRRSEFLAGRACAALALRAAGQPEHVGRAGRAPIWPVGVVGSISHGQSRVVAAVSTQLSALGVDCETVMPDARADLLHQEILTLAEGDLRPDQMTFATFVTLVFSGKEAVYKALATRLSQMPGFLDVTLTAITPATLTLVLNEKAYPVRYRIDQGECLTLLALP